jgi:Na+/H+ antiporter NhaD/arsenite permease-like protein
LFILAIAILPLFFPHFWEKNRNKLLVALAAMLPVLLYLATAEHGLRMFVTTLEEYAAFIALLAGLFIISGGIWIRGSLAGTPVVNTGFLGLGAILASVIGTTGASMLLLRPLLRANEKRMKKVHIVIFFIFIVSNAGGLLTPLGDPPLFLGFLRRVPFLWTLKLLAPWALVNGALLVIFNIVDQVVLNKEEREREGSQLEEVQKIKEPIRIEGGLNFLWLLGVLGINSGFGYLARRQGWSDHVQKLALVLGMSAMAGLSLATTSREIRRSNKFTWGPIVEVAVLFIGIFVTMAPATLLLEEMGKSGAIRMTRPWEFFWGAGGLSSFLDNAPTYVTFAALACGRVGALHGLTIDPSDLGALLQYPDGVLLLEAVSCGSVFMGANTYIGNGPNFMVKAIAEENQVRMPSFFGYMLWALGVLIPLFILVTFLFFVGPQSGGPV